MLSLHNSKKDFEQTDCTVAVLPVGAVEQHGSHLPVGTDTIFATALSERISEKLGAYLLPVIPISSSIEHRKAKGTVYVKGDTLALIVRDIAESLQFSGFKQLIVVNFHGGNWIIKPTVRLMNRELGIQTLLLDPGIPEHKLQQIMKHTKNDIHAGEMETSLMMHLHPELVGQIKPQSNPKFYPQAYMDYFDTTELTEDGYWGFPEEATAEKGRKMMESLVDHALETIRALEQARLEIGNRMSKAKKADESNHVQNDGADEGNQHGAGE